MTPALVDVVTYGGGAVILSLIAVVLVMLWRLELRSKLAYAWAQGYTTRGYDDILELTSPNPYKEIR